MADVTYKLSGLEALKAKFEALDFDTRRKGGRFALRKASQFIADKVRENASRLDDPETAESIERNITLRWNGRLFKRKGDLGFRVGVMGGARQYADSSRNRRKGRVGQEYLVGDKTNPGGDTWYWRLLEFGTQKMAAKPFMRPALADNVTTATDIFAAEFTKSINRAIGRASKI